MVITPVKGSTDCTGRKFSTSSEAFQIYLFTDPTVAESPRSRKMSQIVELGGLRLL